MCFVKGGSRDCCNLRQRRPGIKVVAEQMIL